MSARKKKNNNGLLSIGQAAEQLGVSKKTLRNWEKKGILSSTRTKGGHRRYYQSVLGKLAKKKRS